MCFCFKHSQKEYLTRVHVLKEFQPKHEKKNQYSKCARNPVTNFTLLCVFGFCLIYLSFIPCSVTSFLCIFQYPLKEVVVIHQDPEALKDIQSLQKYILEVGKLCRSASWQEMHSFLWCCCALISTMYNLRRNIPWNHVSSPKPLRYVDSEEGVNIRRRTSSHAACILSCNWN